MRSISFFDCQRNLWLVNTIHNVLSKRQNINLPSLLVSSEISFLSVVLSLIFELIPFNSVRIYLLNVNKYIFFSQKIFVFSKFVVAKLLIVDIWWTWRLLMACKTVAWCKKLHNRYVDCTAYETRAEFYFLVFMVI